jgi:hypothetical protein
MAGENGQLPPDNNIGPTALAANWTEAGVALILVVLRMFTQIFIVGRIGIDDYLIVLAQVSTHQALTLPLFVLSLAGTSSFFVYYVDTIEMNANVRRLRQ